MAKRIVKVNMTGVTAYTKASEGDHVARLAKIEEKADTGNLLGTFEITKGEDKGAKVFETFGMSDTALWKLKQFLEAAGMKADGKLSLDLDAIEGKAVVISVIHEEYNNTLRAKIAEFKPLTKGKTAPPPEDDEDDYDDEDDDDDEPAPPPKKKKSEPAKIDKKKAKKKPAPEPEDDDDDDDDEDDDE